MDSTSPNAAAWHILLVDDDEDDYIITRYYLEQFKGRKVQLDWAADFRRGQEALAHGRYDAALVDYDLGSGTGIELIAAMSALGCPTPIILYTGRGSYEVDLEAMAAGATMYLTKTEGSPLLLERAIRYAIQMKQAEADLRAAQAEAEARATQAEAGQRALQAVTNLLAQLVKDAPAGIAFLEGPEHRYTLVNPVYEQISRGKGELIGQPVTGPWGEIAEQVVPIMDRVLRSGESYAVIDQHFNVWRGDHFEPGYFTFTMAPIRRPPPEQDGVMIIALETTTQIQERRQAEAHDRFLVELSNELLAVTDAAAAVGTVVNRLGPFLAVDRCLVEALGESGGRVPGLPDYARDLPSLADRYPLRDAPAAIAAALRAGEQVVVADVRADERVRTAPAAPLSDVSAFVATPGMQGGRWLGALVVTRQQPSEWAAADLRLLQAVTNLLWITLEKLRLLQELQVNEGRYRVAAETMAGMIYDWDIAGGAVYHSERFARLLGVAPAETDAASGSDWWFGRLHPADQDAKAAIQQTIFASQEGSFRLEYRVRHADGHWVTVEDHGVIERDAAGAPRRLVGVVTERPAAAPDPSRTADLVGFAQTAAYDLRSPLRKMAAFIGQVLASEATELAAVDREALERSLSSARQTQRLLRDLATFAQVSAGPTALAPVDLNVTARAVLEELDERLTATGGTVTLTPLPTIRADADQMHQLLLHLIDNALKYARPATPPRVHVSARPMPEGHVCLVVADNGIGFPPEQLEQAVDAFRAAPRGRRPAARGIGLALCQRIVSQHHGELRVEANPNQGTTFLACLPRDAVRT
jgi:PAS domain S-box-containing protein